MPRGAPRHLRLHSAHRHRGRCAAQILPPSLRAAASKSASCCRRAPIGQRTAVARVRGLRQRARFARRAHPGAARRGRGAGRRDQFAVYPTREALRRSATCGERRRKLGLDMYRLLGITKGDTDGILAARSALHLLRPVGIIITVDKAGDRNFFRPRRLLPPDVLPARVRTRYRNLPARGMEPIRRARRRRARHRPRARGDLVRHRRRLRGPVEAGQPARDGARATGGVRHLFRRAARAPMSTHYLLALLKSLDWPLDRTYSTVDQLRAVDARREGQAAACSRRQRALCISAEHPYRAPSWPRA